MIFKDEASLKKHIQSEETAPAYLLFGSEGYLVRQYAALLTRKLGQGCGGSFDLLRLDGEKLDCDALCDWAEAMPLMATQKCALIEKLEPEKLSADKFALLEALLEDIPPTCVLVITGGEAFGDKKSARTKKCIALLQKHGAVAELGTRQPGDLAKFIAKLAKPYGSVVKPEICRYLISLCGTDMNTLQNEATKVFAFAGACEVTRAHVDEVVAPKLEAKVFGLTKAILAENYKEAMETLSGLFYLREQPVAIHGVLCMTYTDLYRAKVAIAGGISQAQAVQDFGYKGREFRWTNAARLCAKLSLDYLRGALALLLELDTALKSTGGDSRILLEQAITNLFVLRQKHR